MAKPKDMKSRVDELLDKRVSTRAGGGRIAARRSPSSAPSRTDGDDTAQQTPQAARGRNRIAAEDLAPLKARILLMLALTATRDEGEIQRMFVEY